MPAAPVLHVSFSEIAPFVRYVQYITLDPAISGQYKKLYDHRLTYICGGCGEIQIGDQAYPCQKGDLFYWGPDILYAVHRKAENPLTVINIHFDFTQSHRQKKFMPPASFLPHFQAELITEQVELEDAPLFNKPFYLPACFQLERSFFLMVEEYRLQKLFSSPLLNGQLLSLLASIYRHLAHQGDSAHRHRELADEIMDYIHSNLDKSLTNRSVAARFSFHPNYLNRLFVRHTGTPLHRYILNTKADKAMELLHSTALSVTEIARSLDFCDISHFSKFFKERYGVSPSSLRAER
ncbi:MAG: transcriptional regulator, AraC family [Paenibacillaceae bacterium]|jgi:AraC-like DNA-binding protein|nr:transcriptional regulator, AraC family [Paenibacillaceae bacterium]